MTVYSMVSKSVDWLVEMMVEDLVDLMEWMWVDLKGKPEAALLDD